MKIKYFFQNTAGEVGTSQRPKVHLEMFVKQTGFSYLLLFIIYYHFYYCILWNHCYLYIFFSGLLVFQTLSALLVFRFYKVFMFFFRRQHWGEISCYDSCDFCDSMSSCDFSSCFDDTVFTDTLIQKVIFLFTKSIYLDFTWSSDILIN